jgi:hypothetical protein
MCARSVSTLDAAEPKVAFAGLVEATAAIKIGAKAALMTGPATREIRSRTFTRPPNP